MIPERTSAVFDIHHIGLSLYIHIPWCIKKCPYCDFNSHALPEQAPFSQYTDALIQDTQIQSRFTVGRAISSVFIGGGTPSLLPVSEYRRLFAYLRDVFEFAPNCEITLEANPATLEHAPFDEYIKLGINRLSLGVQSFDALSLQKLGRIHTPKHAIEALQNAKKAGFERINADIMHGLPNQTPELALTDLQTAQEYGATHISWYQLTIEPATSFYKNPPILPNEEILADIEQTGYDFLRKQKWDNYEISAWASEKDTPCVHNMNYWTFGDYLAIGAGAHGKITLLQDQWRASWSDIVGVNAKQGVYRFCKTRSPKDYLAYHQYPKFAQFYAIKDCDLPSEFMMNALRLRNGVHIQDFEKKTGLWISTIDNELIPLKHQGLMVDNWEKIAPTPLGFRYVNHLVQAFL